MKHHTYAERAEFEAWLDKCWSRQGHIDAEGDFSYDDDWVQGAFVGWAEGRRAPAAPVPQQDVEKLRAELAEEVEAADDWRRLALQFDGHRMQAIGHLKAMLTDPQGSEANALAFIKAPPLHGDAVLAQRIAAIAAAPQPPKAAPVQMPEYGIDTANHAGIRVRGYTEQQVRELLANHGIKVNQ